MKAQELFDLCEKLRAAAIQYRDELDYHAAGFMDRAAGELEKAGYARDRSEAAAAREAQDVAVEQAGPFVWIEEEAA